MYKQIIPAHKRLDFSDLIWLVYTVFLFIEPIYRHSLRYWLQTLFVLAVFIAVYVCFLRFSVLRLRLTLLGVMFLMGLCLYPWNQGSPCFMIYSAALLPLTLYSIPWIAALVGFEAVSLLAVGWHFHMPPVGYGINTLMLGIASVINIFAAQKLRADFKLRLQQEEIEALAAVAERERIARDLHDVLGHTLSVIVLKSELAGRLLERENSPDASVERSAEDLRRARTEIADVEHTARTALAEVREAIGGYRARGLAAEIEAARQTLATAGVSLRTEGDLQHTALSAGEETVLALALREAVTNIVRHARASECRLGLRRDAAGHRLFIRDNGQNAGKPEGNGLRGMRERVESLGGQLSLSHDGGTQLSIDLPLRAGAAS